MFTYAKTFEKLPFHVVHKRGGQLTYTVRAFPDKVSAAEDAAKRNERARNLGIECTYEVCPREEGKVGS